METTQQNKSMQTFYWKYLQNFLEFFYKFFEGLEDTLSRPPDTRAGARAGASVFAKR